MRRLPVSQLYGIFELRIRYYRQNYRILYSFHGEEIVVLLHGLVKETKVPDREINLAVERKRRFEMSPEVHTYYED